MENGPIQAKGGSSINRIFRLSLLPEGMLPCYIQVDLIDTTTCHYESGMGWYVGGEQRHKKEKG
jgi:hypothetical protein